MSYFPDLSPYTYIRRVADETTLNVGWLDRAHAFPRGTVSPEILDKVFSLCRSPVNKTRGFHHCPFCKNPPFGLPVEHQGVTTKLGSAEIRVSGKNGRIHAAPDLIFHYMRDHQYLPPEEFLEAVASLKP